MRGVRFEIHRIRSNEKAPHFRSFPIFKRLWVVFLHWLDEVGGEYLFFLGLGQIVNFFVLRRLVTSIIGNGCKFITGQLCGFFWVSLCVVSLFITLLKIRQPFFTLSKPIPVVIDVFFSFRWRTTFIPSRDFHACVHGCVSNFSPTSLKNAPEK